MLEGQGAMTAKAVCDELHGSTDKRLLESVRNKLKRAEARGEVVRVPGVPADGYRLADPTNGGAK